ncbi:hypothetical protein B7463_g179, partial [Scytalidium lignicola]
MASSRESSVDAGSVPASPSQLTPRSKVKAMLASLDDSDDDTSSGSTRVTLFKTIPKDAQSEQSGDHGSSMLAHNSSSRKHPEEEEEEDIDSTKLPGGLATLVREMDESSDDDDIIQPKGRMASRMQIAPETFEKDEQAMETARSRVRKLFLAEHGSQQPSTTARSEQDNENVNKNDVVSKKSWKLTKRRHNGSLSPRNRSRTGSPSLFVSPAKGRASPMQSGSDSEELPINPAADDRFKALVERKRQERLAKEAETAKQRAERAAEKGNQSKGHGSLVEDDIGASDDDTERRLTQQAPPTRKASKKALEEMHREAQRLSRNMQLAHEARTKKKITKDSLFAKFNYRPAGLQRDPAIDPIGTASSSQKSQSETGTVDTPPTSPPSHEEEYGKFNKNEHLSLTNATSQPKSDEAEDEELPPLNDDLSIIEVTEQAKKIEKGKGKEIESEQEQQQEQQQKRSSLAQRHNRIPLLNGKEITNEDDSDSDLEIISPLHRKRLDTIFDRLPLQQTKESHSLQALRALAHLGSPSKKQLKRHANAFMSTSELQALLLQRAREQAVREKEERLQALRDRGIIILTAEERGKELAELEDLISKARREGEEIKRREKAAAKKGQNDNGDGSSDDSDWDDSVTDSSESENDENGVDADGDEDSMDDEEEITSVHPMFEEDVSESEEDGDTRPVNEANGYDKDKMKEDENEEQPDLPSSHIRRRKRNTRVLSDDEEETESSHPQPTPMTKSPVQLHSESPMPPNSVLRSATKTFIPGVTVAGPAGLGLTQIFAGTMDDSQNDPFDGSPLVKRSTVQITDTDSDSLAFLRKLRAPELPPFNPTMKEDSQDLITDSQVAVSQIPESQPVKSDSQSIQLQFSQSQIHGFDSLVQDPMDTQFSEVLGGTQDVGFLQTTPIRGRFVEPPSTVATVLVEPTPSPKSATESVVDRKRGKLRRRTHASFFSDDEESFEAPRGNGNQNDESEITPSIFDVMRNAAKKKTVITDGFDKKKSKAREIVDEQAEESEDEYAGLGGASDDNESDSEDEYVKAIIDDEAGKDADEGQLAAFYADRERASDEKQIEKLYNDVTRGMLRRKRGADYDLSDSDDDGESRRRMKRKEFARMRKALLADERIGKIVEDPKKQAFLRAIEDRPSEDEMDFLEDFAEPEDKDSQGTDSEHVAESQHDTSTVLQKRKHQDDANEPGIRPPPRLRRTNPSKKPSNLAEIRQSLSSIIEEPNAIALPADIGSDSDDDLEVEEDGEHHIKKSNEKENRDPFAVRRTNQPIIDRISLKRASSSSLSSSSRLAFAAPSVTSGFKVPALLRRATTNSSIASASSTSSGVGRGMSATERMAGGAGGDNIKRGGGKKSGVNFFVRESERRAALVKTEKRREQRMFKGADVRRKVVGGLLGSGKFE